MTKTKDKYDEKIDSNESDSDESVDKKVKIKQIKDKSSLNSEKETTEAKKKKKTKSKKTKKYETTKTETTKTDTSKTDTQKTNKSETEQSSTEPSETKSDGIIFDSGNFSVVPGIKAHKQDLVRRSLPNWLRNPNFIPASLANNKTPVEKLQHLLSDGVLKSLKENNYTEFFPVQTELMKELLHNSSSLSGLHMAGGVRGSDICCSAPTGSGKTLAFVLPIVQMLSQCTFRSVRCLVVVPVVELATQVFKVFQLFANHTRLKIGLANGLRQFSSEQHKLVAKNARGSYSSKVDIVVCTPGRLVDHLQSTPGFNLTHLRFIVIDEADRMMEEVKHDWLDLVDRAVSKPTNHRAPNDDDDDDDDSGNDDDVNEVTIGMSRDTTNTEKKERILEMISSSPSLSSSFIYDHFNLLTGDNKTINTTTHTLNALQKPQIHLQKLLFSATLSHNPEKLQQLRLHHPKLFTSVVREGCSGGGDDKNGEKGMVVKEGGGDVKGEREVMVGGKTGLKRKLNDNGDNNEDGDNDGDEPCNKKARVEGDANVLDEKTCRNEFLGKYVTPPDLTEHFVMSDAGSKPLMLMYLIKHFEFKSVLCFTNSVQAAKRLSTLMGLMGVKVREFTSSLHMGRRSRTIQAFNSNNINMIVATDAMSRGLDLDDVDCVVSYNVPSSFKTYIHRVGRTARAGSAGRAVALLEKKEIFHFKKIMRESGKEKVKEMKVQRCLVQKYKPAYEAALLQLPDALDEGTVFKAKKLGK